MHTSGKERVFNEPQDNSEDSAASTLESAERYIAGSKGTGSSCDGSGAAFSTTFAAFVDWAEKAGLIRTTADFDFFSRQRDAYGDEHEAWFEQPLKRWFKATYENRFGLAWGRDGTATVHEYLRRLMLQNAHFGDDIQLIALINCGGKIRVLISQPHIAGSHAEPGQIEQWFSHLHFKRIDMSGRIAWYFETENLLIADAHEGNVLQTAAGTLVPIDLNIIQPRGELWEWLQAEIKGESQMMLRFSN
jgi:Serine/Threonine/Tyrosine Kinase found in polyvalent proteins